MGQNHRRVWTPIPVDAHVSVRCDLRFPRCVRAQLLVVRRGPHGTRLHDGRLPTDVRMPCAPPNTLIVGLSGEQWGIERDLGTGQLLRPL